MKEYLEKNDITLSIYLASSLLNYSYIIIIYYIIFCWLRFC